MQRPRVLCTVDLKLAPDALAPLHRVADVDHLRVDSTRLAKIIGSYDVYFGNAELKVDAHVLRRASRLCIIASPSTGTDHIDVNLARSRGITLLTLTKEYKLLDSFTATAECAWGLLLACLRRIPAASEAARRGDWARERFTGRQLSGKTLGVIGVGRLGKMVVEYGKAFRMHVLGCDPKPFRVAGVRRVSLETLLRASDVISIHVHLTDATRGMIGRVEFAKMKRGVVIVNTSRGAIIDERAFLQLLGSGKVAAAGLDVIHGEWVKNVSNHPLIRYARKHDNLVITPHIGGATVESIADARVFMARRLADHILECWNA